MSADRTDDQGRRWTFLTNHARSYWPSRGARMHACGASLPPASSPNERSYPGAYRPPDLLPCAGAAEQGISDEHVLRHR